MKIRIFALAKELGLDSKVLIDLCNQAGVQIKASALASITPEERDRVLKILEEQGAEPPPEPDEDLAPVRDNAPNVGKVRAIRTMTPRAQGRSGSGTAVAAPPEMEQPEVAVPEPPADTPPPPTDDESGGSDESETPEESPAVEEPVEEPAVAAEATEATEATETVEEQPPETPAPAPIPTMKREDYMPASGGSRPMREMKPIGTVKEDSQPRKPKQKSPALPNIAAPPSYKPPVAREQKKPAEPVQKPDVPLTADILEQQSPLADRLRRIKDPAAEQRSGGRGRQQGSLLSQLQRERQQQRQNRQPRRKKKRGPVELKTSAQIDLPINVRSLSEAIGRPARAILSHLFREGRMATINEQLTEEDALDISMEFGVDLEIRRSRDLEAELTEQLDTPDPEESLESRPPIITILGHVDHGKTTLVDRLRNAQVAAGEAGGITQHIAAYQVNHNGNLLTFVDTPGHAAFGEMRARGANVTDIVVLVVAADDGVMPQTEECISHARAAGVPIVVAMNKIDLPDVDEQRVLQGLAAQEVLPAEWGGDVEVVRTSGETGQGLDDLLETLMVTSELLEFKANPSRSAIGVCLEAFRDEGRGALAWFVVQKGTLRVGDLVLCGPSYGRIRAMYNDRDEELQEAGPSVPVKVAGLDNVPDAGDHFFVLDDVDEARTVAEQRRDQGRTAELSRRAGPRTMEDILNAAKAGEVRELSLIIKADTPGSLEALRSEIDKFEHEEVSVTIIHDGVGGVNESDVSLASASGAVIIAFHVVPEERARVLAEQEGVEIRRYSIIYEVTEHIRNSLEGMLKPERVQVTTGRALVLQTFHISRFGTIAGCRVLNGTISRDNRVHVIRDQKVLNDYRIASLKREKDDVKEVREGMECGIRLDGFNDVKEGDLFEAYRIDEIQRKLED